MDPNNINNPPVTPQPRVTTHPTVDPIPPIVPTPSPTQPEIPVVQTIVNSPSTGVEPAKKFPWKWIILGVLLFLILVGIGIFIFFQIKSKNSFTQSGSDGQYTYTPIVVPTDTPKPVTLAPLGTTDFSLQYWRTTKAMVTEAQQIDKEVGPIFGEIVFPVDLKFIHEEVYKGIPIKWTASQPIPEGRLAWIKVAIDQLPPLFITNHPITGIISATVDELKVTDPTSRSRLSIAAAFASGLNIFVTNNILIDKPGYVPLKQTEMTSALFHEWTHVVQYYEALQTFTEAFLKIPGNSIIATRLVPFVKDFAKTVGWDYGEDQYADNIYPKLKTDAESQKTSDYGKEYEYEDQAETMAAFLTCQTGNFSQARIQWAEKVTNTSVASYCN